MTCRSCNGEGYVLSDAGVPDVCVWCLRRAETEWRLRQHRVSEAGQRRRMLEPALITTRVAPSVPASDRGIDRVVPMRRVAA